MAKVLIVEDSASQAQLMSEIVMSVGHQAVILEELSRGIAQNIQAITPDLVLLDLTLLGPDGKQIADGFQICREIKRISNNKIGVIIVSAKSDRESTDWAVLQGADAFLQKPFVVKDLVKVLNEVLAQGE